MKYNVPGSYLSDGPGTSLLQILFCLKMEGDRPEFANFNRKVKK